MIVALVPPLIKSISAIGTIAMLAVGGGIVAHQTGVLHGVEQYIKHHIESVSFLIIFIMEIIFELFIGYITVLTMPILVWARRRIKREL